MTLTLYDFCTTLKKVLKTVDNKAVWLLMSLYEQNIEIFLKLSFYVPQSGLNVYV